MFQKPLAYRLRPTCLDEVFGQKDLLNENSLLRNSIKEKTPFSIIFFGEPGCGKTTLAEAYAKESGFPYLKLNAVKCNKKDLEEAIKKSEETNSPTLIIMDEVHRLNKDKQDILLPYLEDGTFYLLGMTTQNPYLAINKALRSRTQLLEVKPLTNGEIIEGLKYALTSKKGLSSSLKVDDDALNYIANISSGDLRYALNILEALSVIYKNKNVSLANVKEMNKVPNYTFDEDEDGHYDSVSALQKSIRGSDVNASLYYLSRIAICNDLESIIRRLLVTAYEDIGLGNPQAVDRTYKACKVAREIGFPEAIIPLGFSVCELALSPKSKATTLAVEKAYNFAKENRLDIQDYLRLTPINISQEDKYPYDRCDLWNKIQYLPNQIKDIEFYFPFISGSVYEKAINENYLKLKQIKRTNNLRDLKKL